MTSGHTASATVHYTLASSQHAASSHHWLATNYHHFLSTFAHMLSPQWWLDSILTAWREEPLHVLFETCCIAIIIFLLIKRSYDPHHRDPGEFRRKRLTPAVEEELISTWEPQPLVPTVQVKKRHLLVDSIADRIVQGKTAAHQQQVEDVEVQMKQLESHVKKQPTNSTLRQQLTDVKSQLTSLQADRTYLNFSTYNFLSFVQHPAIKEISRAAIEKYGVGSCGPRGFYGSFDVHINLEKHLAAFFGGAECVLYSDSMGSISSVIPAYCKRGDLIICDEAVNYGIQQGILLSRSNVKYYKHNDMQDLERVLATAVAEHNKSGKKLNRRFIVTEGISAYYGDIAPLDKIVALRHKYKFRIILDDSLAVGVLGATGRGSIEEFDVKMEDVELLCGTLDAALGSVGGFCVSAWEFTIDHQRLTSAGYVFSATSPPYTAAAGSKALELIDKNPQLCQQLRQKSTYMHQLLSDIPSIALSNSLGSPLFYVRLAKSRGSTTADADIMDAVIMKLLETPVSALKVDGIALTAPDYVPFERRTPDPAVRLVVCIHHTEQDLKLAAEAVKATFEQVLTGRR